MRRFRVVVRERARPEDPAAAAAVDVRAADAAVADTRVGDLAACGPTLSAWSGARVDVVYDADGNGNNEDDDNNNNNGDDLETI